MHVPFSRVGFGLGGELIGRRSLSSPSFLILTGGQKNAAADTCALVNVGLRDRTQQMNRDE